MATDLKTEIVEGTKELVSVAHATFSVGTTAGTNIIAPSAGQLIRIWGAQFFTDYDPLWKLIEESGADLVPATVLAAGARFGFIKLDLICTINVNKGVRLITSGGTPGLNTGWLRYSYITPGPADVNI